MGKSRDIHWCTIDKVFVFLKTSLADAFESKIYNYPRKGEYE
jgi:hypothetical protein